jgi:hypothetical protein
MPRFILSTLEALASGDINPLDASYSLSAHLLSGCEGAGVSLSEADVQRHVDLIVEQVGRAAINPVQGAKKLAQFKERLATGLTAD